MPPCNITVKERALHFLDPRFFITIIIMGLFAWAFGSNPEDGTMKGALIAGFAGAWGFWLGSSKGSSDKAAQMERMQDK